MATDDVRAQLKALHDRYNKMVFMQYMMPRLNKVFCDETDYISFSNELKKVWKRELNCYHKQGFVTSMYNTMVHLSCLFYAMGKAGMISQLHTFVKDITRDITDIRDVPNGKFEDVHNLHRDVLELLGMSASSSMDDSSVAPITSANFIKFVKKCQDPEFVKSADYQKIVEFLGTDEWKKFMMWAMFAKPT